MTQRMQAQYVQFYISGSSAMQLNTVAPKKAEPMLQTEHRMQKRIRIFVDPVALFSMVVALCMIITIFIGMGHLEKAQKEVQQMEQYVVYLQHQHKNIKAEYSSMYNLEDIEKTALALGMVPAEEVDHFYIDVTEPVVEEPTIWESVGTFLTGLFA